METIRHRASQENILKVTAPTVEKLRNHNYRVRMRITKKRGEWNDRYDVTFYAITPKPKKTTHED